MTEPEWLNSLLPNHMYDVIRDHVTTRQVRLYMVACCRLRENEIFDARIPIALEAAERCADDSSAEAAANAIWNKLITSVNSPLPQFGDEGVLALAITGASQLLNELWDDGASSLQYRNPRHAFAHAVFMSLRDRPQEALTGSSYCAAEYCARMVASVDLLRKGVELVEDEVEFWRMETDIRREIAGLLRDIFGNPFRPVAFDPSWRTSTAVALAEGIYADRAFDRLPILADALEDAGCDAADLLAHCRGEGPHVRGCWAVDLVLGKS